MVVSSISLLSLWFLQHFCILFCLLFCGRIGSAFLLFGFWRACLLRLSPYSMLLSSLCSTSFVLGVGGRRSFKQSASLIQELATVSSFESRSLVEMKHQEGSPNTLTHSNKDDTQTSPADKQ